MAQIKLGFIGCGAHATRNLQPCIPLIPEIDFVATCDISAVKAESNAKRFGAKRWYTDYREMIATEEIDAVAIVGHPKTMHTDLAIACMELGKHVFIEKPPAINVEDAARLAETSARTGKFGMVATMWRHAPAHRMAKRIIRRAEFGEPLLFEGRYLAPSPRGAHETLEWAYLLDQGVHIVDCMRYLVGDVTNLRAFEHFGADGRMAFAVSLQFDNGAVGTLNMIAGAPTLETSVMVAGDGGHVIQVHNMQQVQYLKPDVWQGVGGYQDFPTLEWNQGTHYRGYGRPGYLEELEHFARLLLSGRQPQASLADACAVMRICQAITDSHQQSASVQIKRG